METNKTHTIEIRCRAIKRVFGLFDHFFMIIDNNEYHFGFYSKGLVLPKGTTKSSHLATIRTICHQCYIKLMIDLEFKEDARLFSYYPILNCETLSYGLSIQTICFLNFLFIPILLLKKHYWLSLVFSLSIIIVLLFFSKYQYSRTLKKNCNHLK